MKIRVCLKYFVNGCLWKQSLASDLSQTPSVLVFLTIIITLRPLYSFDLKLEQLIGKQGLKVVLFDNYFLDLFT